MINPADFKKWLQVFNVPSGGGGGGAVTQQEVQNFAFNYAEASGVDDAFIVNLNPPVESLVDNLIISMSSGMLQNLTDSPTLQVDSLPAKQILLWAGALTPGDIATNSSYFFIYNEDGDFFELINPSISAANSFLVQGNAYNSAIDTGAADAYNITLLVPPQSSFGVGFPLYVQIGAGNTNTGASTLTVNGETDDIVLNDGSAIPAGALASNQIYQFLFNNGNWVLMNPSVGGEGVTPAGSVIDYAGTSAPTGYLNCDGSAIDRSTFSDLFAAISTTWGAGDGSTTFNLPNLNRRTTIGSGGTGTGEIGNAVGDTGGEENHTLLLSEIPSHNHQYNSINLVSVQTPGSNIFGNNSGSTGNRGGGGAHNNMPPSAVMLKCIKT